MTHEAETRARTDRDFLDKLYLIANLLCDFPDPTYTWVGEKIAEAAHRASFLDAQSGEDFDDRNEVR